ncbi:MAG TPA: 30S ribosomal protein S2 [Candidatus Paceibacterota bacterium]|nr:30S ribosomal protein S2 [Candidatus Paceibacterota bacterium]
MEKDQIIEKLFSVGAHFGYSPSRRHPSTAPFIYGSKGGTELFDLEKTAGCLEGALAFVKSLAQERKVILFVGGKAEARGALKRVAERLNLPYVASRWIGGTLTNFGEIRKRLNRLTELSDMREKGELGKFTKLERLLIDREITELDLMFGGLRGMNKLPDAVVVIDPRQEDGVVREARQFGIPVIALLNSDCDRSLITYPIPANDASVDNITFILDKIGEAYADNLAPAPTAAPAEAPAHDARA